MGGRAFACEECGGIHFAYHSCNHKACPQCGASATRRWVQHQIHQRINAPYFLVTFTLPAQLRQLFFGPQAKSAFDLFFDAAAGALRQKLAAAKSLRAATSGFVGLLHTWTQKLEFHPHIHFLVPGAGLDQNGRWVRVKKPGFLLYLPHLQAAFRQHLYALLKAHDWPVDPQVWSKDWGVHIQPAGSGAAAIKYLGAYVARTAIGDARLVSLTDHNVTFRWKDRSDHNRSKTLTLPGVEFARRYLLHVLPVGLRSIRYFGFCHPAAKASRLRVQVHSGKALYCGPGESAALPEPAPSNPACPRCGRPTRLLFSFKPGSAHSRGPPASPLAPLPVRATP